MTGMPPYTLSLDAQRHLILSVGGTTLPLVEAAPGLLRDPNDADTQVVLYTDEAGQAYLLTSDPWAYMKVPWYGTTEVRDLLVQGMMMLSLASLIGWSSAALVGLRKRTKGTPGTPRPFLSHLARGVAALFGLVLIAVFVGLDTLLSTKDPVFGYPVILLEKPPIFYILLGLPYVLAGLGLLMLVCTGLAWTRRYWSLAGRLHYTLLTLAGLSVLWGMWYWNLLL